MATSHPLASNAGLDILKQGGTAADAVIAAAAVLGVVEPMSTGVGGDCFCLYYDSRTKTVSGLNGSGRSPANLTLDLLRRKGLTGSRIHPSNPNSVTVPGTVAGWLDIIERFGRLSIDKVLRPSIAIAQEGFPVSPIISHQWKLGEKNLRQHLHGKDLLLDGHSPKPGQLFSNLPLSRVYQEIAKKGRAGFYRGWVADNIVKIL